MPRIEWIDDGDATGAVAEAFAAIRQTSRNGNVPDIARTMSRHAYRITDEQVQALRDAGWSDAQIAEAVYDGALFNLFVRLADAFDIHPHPMMDPDGVPPAATSCEL